MERTHYLQIPGPTNIPRNILNALSRPLINHRGAEFQSLASDCISGLKKVMRTEDEILIFPGSGTGVLESAVVNLFSPGDRILAVCNGVFGERMANIAEAFNLDVTRLECEWATCVNPKAIERILRADTGRKICAVCLPQNETSTGVCNDIRAVSQVIAETKHHALLVVDAVSSLACIPLEAKQWNIDVVVTGSQKGLMLPPGLGIVSVSPRAWKAVEASTMSRWYWDYRSVRESLKANMFPYTPATTLFFGLIEALHTLLDEGMPQVWERHRMIAEAVRTTVTRWGLALFVTDESAFSDSVTSVRMPAGVEFTDLSASLRSNFNVEIGGGLGKLGGKIFRIAHLGSFHTLDAYSVMGAIEMALHDLGCPLELGTASKTIGEMLVGRLP